MKKVRYGSREYVYHSVQVQVPADMFQDIVDLADFLQCSRSGLGVLAFRRLIEESELDLKKARKRKK